MLSLVRTFGVRALIFRVPFELANRSGLRALLERPGVSQARRILVDEHPDYGQDAFRLAPNYILAERGHLLADVQQAQVRWDQSDAIATQVQSLTREVVVFGRSHERSGGHLRWHDDIVSRREWPRVHWSRLVHPSGGYGDIKHAWELARFGYLWPAIRQLAQQNSAAAVDLIHLDIESFVASNPFRIGIHWANGQEMALRTITWLVVGEALMSAGSLAPSLSEQIVRAVTLNCIQIAKHIDYARRSMRNNHLLAEAAALLLVSQRLPSLRHADAWHARGRSLLLEGVRDQFYPDGGYCQRSHNYHRLAIDVVSTAIQSSERFGEQLPQEIPDRIARSVRMMQTFMNPDTGRLPLYGENDGAQLYPCSAADSSDFRPSIAVAAAACHETVAFQAGPWLEAVAWLTTTGPTPVRRDVPQPETLPSDHVTLFPEAGLGLVAHGSDSRAVICVLGRHLSTGHADTNHVDLWLGGRQITTDTGSYLYNEEPHIHQELSSTPAHSTVTVAGASQYRRLRKWSWLRDAAGDTSVSEQMITSRVRAFRHLIPDGGQHERRVAWLRHGWDIRDEVSSSRKMQWMVHWRLLDLDWRILSQDTHGVVLASHAHSHLGLSVRMDIPEDAGQEVPPLISLVPSWYSPRYGSLEPTLSLSVSILAFSASFHTRVWETQ